MTQRKRLERRGHWQDVIRKQQASGLSVSAFCRQHEVPLSSFYNWKRKLKQRRGDTSIKDDEPRLDRDGTMPQGTPTSEEPSRHNTTRNNTAAKFVPLELREQWGLPTPPTDKLTRCEVVLPDGCRIMVPSQCDPNWLREILHVVEERAC
jgi:transposase-like protein